MTANPGQDHYALLGVPRSSTPKELRQAYLQLLVAAHPDKGGDPARFEAIQRAWGVLSDAHERAAYDDRQQGAAEAATASPLVHQQPASVWQNGRGATAYVHGQSHGPPSAAPCRPPDSATAGQRDVPELSDAIKEAKSEVLRSGGDAEALRRLAELHAGRAAAHAAAGRQHHARFDAEEAVRLWPGCEAALNILEGAREGS